MRKAILLILTGLSLFFISTVINKNHYRYDWQNAAWRTGMALFTGTKWAEGFSEEQFAKVKIGMSFEEVKAIVGKPLEGGCGLYGCGLVYSWQDTPTADYDRRWVRFDKNHKAYLIYHDFYIN